MHRCSESLIIIYMHLIHIQQIKSIMVLVDGTCWLERKVQSNAGQNVDILMIQIESSAEVSKPVHH